MTGFELGENMYQCPKYWANFIYDLQDREKNYSRDVAIKTIQRELEKYGARYHFAGSMPNDWISFKDEKYFTMFVLRWS